MQRLVYMLLVVGVWASLAVQPASAQGLPAGGRPPGDQVDLIGLKTRQPTPDSPPSAVQFEAVVRYQLQSADSGYVLLFLFENNAESSTQQSSSGIPIQRGSGQLVLDIDYTMRPDVRNLTLVAGVFRQPQHLLAWVSTNPIDLAPWPGRVAFEKAIADRLANQYAAAEQDLTAAIQAAPDTGNYYYWRGDTRVRLERFDDAIADFSRALELMPQDRASRVGRGIAILWRGDPQAAVGDLTAAIDATSTPDRVAAWAHRARGIANSQLGLPSAAIDDYRAYLAIVPDAADRTDVEAWIADLS
jgi:tetratricopeptide (TPR) repeat protein